MNYRTSPPHTPEPIAFAESGDLLIVPWLEVRILLGHDYGQGENDDAAIYNALIAANAPWWTRFAGGYPDPDRGWVLEKPRSVKQAEALRAIRRRCGA